MSTAVAPAPILTSPSVAAPPSTPPPVFEPPFGGMEHLRKFTVDEYHEMIRVGILKEGEPVELLKGYLVLKMSRTPKHDGTMDLFEGAIEGLLPDGWFLRVQRAIALSDSEPEPDYAIVRGNRRDFLGRHPRPNQIGILVEISKTSLAIDTSSKVSLYAEAGIPIYWVVNVEARKIEVYTEPSGLIAAPAYAKCIEYAVGDSVPLVLDGTQVGAITVADVMA